MALDWGREISFAGLRKSGKRARAAYPSKTYMNLVSSERGGGITPRSVVAGVFVLVLAALVIKFGVFDFYAQVSAKQSELRMQQNTLAAIEMQLSGYDEVLAEFESYESASILESGLVVDALDALSLVDTCVTPYARVTSLTLSGDTLSLKVASRSLDLLGRLVGALEVQDIVANVNLSTAASQQSQEGEVTATVTVSLQPATDDGAVG